MARKSFNEKLGDSKDMPKIVDLSGQPRLSPATAAIRCS